jgi:hypothetical protein
LKEVGTVTDNNENLGTLPQEKCNEDEDAASAIEYVDAVSAIEYVRSELAEDDTVPSVLYRMAEGLGLLLNQWRQSERTDPDELGDKMAQSILFRLGALAEQVWLPYARKVDRTMSAETRARARAIAFLGMECCKATENDAGEDAYAEWAHRIACAVRRRRKTNADQN